MLRARPALAFAAALLAPATALPCDYLPQFVGGVPVENATVPVTAQGYAWIPFMGRFPMVAELYHPEAFAPIPVDTRSLGEHFVELFFPTPLDVGITYDGAIWLRDQPEVQYNFRFTVEDRSDRTPPGAVIDPTFDAYEGPSNSCESSGWYVTVRFAGAPGDALFYELVEYMPNDAQVPVGAAFIDDTDPTLFTIAANVGGDLEGRCFAVRAVDSSGNRGPVEQLHCFGNPGSDAGVPSVDAGGLDTGAEPADAGASPDAGSAPDAGSLRPDAGEATPEIGLRSGDEGCGCSSAHRRAVGGAWAGLLLVGLLLVRRRR